MGTVTSNKRRISVAVNEFQSDMRRHGVEFKELERRESVSVVEVEGVKLVLVVVYNFSGTNRVWRCDCLEELLVRYSPKLFILLAGEAAYPGDKSNKSYKSKGGREKFRYRRIGYASTLPQLRIRQGLYHEIYPVYDYYQLKRGLKGKKFTRLAD